MLYVKALRDALKGLPDDTFVYLTDDYSEEENDDCATLKSVEICKDGVYLYADMEGDEEEEDDEESDCDCEKCSFERKERDEEMDL